MIPSDFLLCYDDRINTLLVNTVFLYDKYYIYCCKYQDKSPRIEKFISKLRNLYTIEGQISLQKNKSDIHNKKWKDLF